VQGACIGGALALASCCDVMVASSDASFAVPEVRLGFAPGPLIGVFMRAMGYRALRRYLLSGERFSAEEAHRVGIVQELCDAQALESVADKLIDEMLLGAPNAAANAKRVLQKQAPAAASAEELKAMQKAFEAMFQSDEATEGRAAFKEKRKPRWYPPR
jgi:methylglutaconyl-CoA hydratase